jgi:hypothetical protein
MFMLKSFRNKMMASVCILVLVFLAVAYQSASVVAASGNIAAFTLVQVDRTTINAGQSVNFTINTIGANFVFADVGGNFADAHQSANNAATGETTWVLTINPTQNLTVIIYANAIEAMEGASAVIIPITVGAAAAEAAPTQPMQQQMHRIYSVEETTAPAPNTVTLTIVTNEAPQFVWIGLGSNQYLQGTLVSRTDTQATWEITYRPPQFVPHQAQVSANHAYVVDEHIATQNITVNLTAPFQQAQRAARDTIPTISRVNASSSNIYFGERTTLTIRTNTIAEYVWAEVDGRRVDAARTNASATTRTFTMEIRPDRTQTLQVFANTTNNTEGAATERITISVGGAEPRIDSANASRTEINWGETARIDVQTNIEVEHVWAIVNGSRVNGRRETNTAAARTWTIDVRPDHSQTITVYANRISDHHGADTRTVRIDVR